MPNKFAISCKILAKNLIPVHNDTMRDPVDIKIVKIVGSLPEEHHRRVKKLSRGVSVNVGTGDTPKDTWWLAMADDPAQEKPTLVGVVSSAIMGNGDIRFRTDIVSPDQRGKGLYDRLFKARLQYTMLKHKKGRITAFSTRYSQGTFARYKFVTPPDREGSGASQQDIIYVERRF